jgi:branched-chain amino acid transport system ATP-binding protein
MKNIETLLRIKNLKVHYGGVKALDGVDISLEKGEMVALMGPNGAGKSTVLKALFGISSIEEGEVCWQGKKIVPKSHEMVQRGISFVPQGRQVFKSLTVYENLEMGGYFIEGNDVLKRRIENVLDIFPDLKKKLKENASDLSGGQQQMLAIARGLVSSPKVLLLDEPSLGLAPKVVKEVFEKIKEINVKKKVTVIVVEHNIQTLLPLCDSVYLLDKGKVVISGAPNIVLDSDVLEDVFMGKIEV